MMRLPQPRLRDGGIPVEDGAALVQWVRYWRPLEISTDDAIGYRHPWGILAHYDLSQERWEIQVYRDSYVSAREVEAPPLPWESAPRVTRARVGDRALSDLVTPHISEEPWLPVPDWRAIGYDAVPSLATEPVPRYFSERGVSPADTLSIVDTTLTLSRAGSTTDRARRRLLRAADVVLYVERERVRIDVVEGVPSIVLDTPRRDLPWIGIQSAPYSPPVDGESIAEQIAASVGDDGIDSLLVGTVYLLSPPGAAPGSEPDRTWTPYVRQNLFWNLTHTTVRQLNVIEPLDLDLDVPLAGGVAQGNVEALLAQIEQDDALASAFLSQARVTGRFWTT